MLLYGNVFYVDHCLRCHMICCTSLLSLVTKEYIGFVTTGNDKDYHDVLSTDDRGQKVFQSSVYSSTLYKI